MKKTWILLIGFLTAIIFLGLINMFILTKTEFWKASAVQLLTPLIAVCVTYIAAQSRNDLRESKKRAEALIEKINRMVIHESFFNVEAISANSNEELRAEIQMTNKRINNCIECLIEYSKSLGISTEAKYIQSEFMTYRELVDENLTNSQKLKELEPAFRKHSENIDAKCDLMIRKLFCP